jgi:acyl-CoA synthetase (AMP-forming)/AMP-acid ligase II
MTTDFQNIPQLLRARISATPDKIFLISQADDRQFTYEQFGDAVQRTASLLAGKVGRQSLTCSFRLPSDG